MEVLSIRSILLILLLLVAMPVHAQAPEYQVKAAMLANFALFVDWPSASFPTANSPFVCSVLGENQFGNWLKSEMGERVGPHPVEVRNVKKPEEAQGSHIIFISRSEQPRLKEALSDLEETGALLVSDVDDIQDFCHQGGMIGLVMEGGKVRFELNADAAAKAGLKIDSRLKRLARSTDCGGGR